MVLKVLFAGAVSFVAVNCNSVLPPPDCYATKAPAGVDCLDPELCIKLPPAEGVLVCYHDGIHAPAQGYTRAIYAAEELICRMDAYADEYCVGDPSEGLELDGRLTPAQQAIANPYSRASGGGRYTNLWPLKDGFYEVPYQIKSPGSWNNEQTEAFLWTLRWFEVNSLIRFVERTDQRDYISVVESTSGCSSYLGCTGGAQPLKLEQGCKISSVMAHELLHALGSQHEHQRADRDDHIDVQYENVSSGKEDQFSKRISTQIVAPYDYVSLMHYSSTIFTKDGRPTMVPKDSTKKRLIDSVVMAPSVCDWYSINKYYGGYNIPANDKCKPNVYVDICKPTDRCHYDCQRECNEWCEQGMRNQLCELRWDLDTLNTYVTKYSGSGVPFDYPTYDPYPDEDPTGAGSVSGGSGGDASGGSGGDDETAGGAAEGTGGAAGGVLSTRCAVAAIAATLIAAALFD